MDHFLYQVCNFILQSAILKTCKEIRNAAAHSNCILNDLTPYTADHKTRYEISRELGKIEGLSKNIREKKMSNSRIQQIITVLYAYNRVVTSKSVKADAKIKLDVFVTRMLKNIEYYDTNDTIRSSFEFLKLVIDKWYLNN